MDKESGGRWVVKTYSKDRNPTLIADVVFAQV